MKSRIYLDHAATTPVLPAAITAMSHAASFSGNPSSVHGAGRDANALVERARDRVADWAGVTPDRVIFTSGGTEALALALQGSGAARVLAGATEHSAVLGARDDIEILTVDGDGHIDLAVLDRALGGPDNGGAGHNRAPVLVAVQHGNNETGVVQDIATIARRCAAAGARLLVDAVQSAGKIPLPTIKQADFIAVSAHKLGGPMGVGALIVRDPASLTALFRGGGQERGLRGGTPNIPGIAGFAAALVPHDWSHTNAVRIALEQRLVAAGAEINGEDSPRLPHITSIRLAGVAANTQVMHLDMAGFMVSAGAACSSGKVRDSHVLAAMGRPVADSIRVSLGRDTRPADVAAFATVWEGMSRRLRRMR